MKKYNLSNTTLILGFFDGIHIGHRKVIEAAVNYAKLKNSKTVLLTFPSSPAEYFNLKVNYICSRVENYKKIKNLGVDIIEETDFTELVNISAADYLQDIISKYKPLGVFTGFNYTFGNNREGDSEFLKRLADSYGYEYFCVEQVKFKNKIVSSTLIKKLLTEGNIDEANLMLKEPFTIKSKVIKGTQIGRKLGFPTANMNYPKNIVKLPYGVYKVKLADNKSGVLNWGIKPTFNGKKPILEIHIPNCEIDLYGKTLEVQILKRIRKERKFDSIDELKQQIKKDIEECLK